MKSLTMTFQVHQPYRLRLYRFFDIGNDHYYYDDYANETLFNWLSRNCYLPACAMLHRKLIQHRGDFRFALYISGVTLDLLQKYAPETIDAFRRLTDTGLVELAGGTWSHSLASLVNRETFMEQVKLHKKAIRQHFGQEPCCFFNTELLYSDKIGSYASQAGYRCVFADGTRHILGWKSPDRVYCNAVEPGLRLMMRNAAISNDLGNCLPPTSQGDHHSGPEKYLARMEKSAPGDQNINLFLDLETLGVIFPPETGIFTFMENLISLAARSEKLEINTPGRVAAGSTPASMVSVPNPLAWAGEDGEVPVWTGNELQEEALSKLYMLAPRIRKCNDEILIREWLTLQSADHFRHMSSSFYEKELKHRPSPFKTPHEAFINFMNIMADMSLRLNKTGMPTEISSEWEILKKENESLKQQIETLRKEIHPSQQKK